jgi:hypothetical protein
MPHAGTLRRLELRRSPGTSSGYVAGPRPDDCIAVMKEADRKGTDRLRTLPTTHRAGRGIDRPFAFYMPLSLHWGPSVVGLLCARPGHRARRRHPLAPQGRAARAARRAPGQRCHPCAPRRRRRVGSTPCG